MCRTGGNQRKIFEPMLENEDYETKKRHSYYTIIINRLKEDISRLQAKNKELMKQNTNLGKKLDKLNSLQQQ